MGNGGRGNTSPYPHPTRAILRLGVMMLYLSWGGTGNSTSHGQFILYADLFLMIKGKV